MQKLSAIAFCLLVSFSKANAEPFKGVAIFAAHSKRFPCSRALASLRNVERPGIQTLYGTFGTNWACVKRFMHRNRERPHLVAINMLNGPNRRSRGLFAGEIAPKLTTQQFQSKILAKDKRLFRAISKRAKRVAQFIEANRNENTVFRIYPELEDNLSNRAFNILARAFREHFPNDEIYRSGFLSPSIAGADGLELHGFSNSMFQRLERTRTRETGKRFCSWSNDGIGIDIFRRVGGQSYVSRETLRSSVSRLRNARCDVFLWDFRWQGISERFVKPRQRQFEFTTNDVRLVRRELRR